MADVLEIHEGGDDFEVDEEGDSTYSCPCYSYSNAPVCRISTVTSKVVYTTNFQLQIRIIDCRVGARVRYSFIAHSLAQTAE